jgi:hypothetical protein
VFTAATGEWLTFWVLRGMLHAYSAKRKEELTQVSRLRGVLLADFPVSVTFR